MGTSRGVPLSQAVLVQRETESHANCAGPLVGNASLFTVSCIGPPPGNSGLSGRVLATWGSLGGTARKSMRMFLALAVLLSLSACMESTGTIQHPGYNLCQEATPC